MKQIKKTCIFVFLIFMLGGCASRTETYLEMTEQEDTSAVETAESVPETEREKDPILVYVCGEVVTPGVYELTTGMRICDAVEAAGGFTEEASREYWNLAELLTDGQMLYFPTEEEALEREKAAGDDLTEGTAGADGRININTADAAGLMNIPGIGQTRAEAILAYRNAHGSFDCVEDIMKVSGIKDALFEKMKDYITTG